MPTLKAQQSERTKAALIAAARTLFAERGYTGVSAEEIAAAANVTTGAVYHQFASKRGLFVATFEHVEEELTARLMGAAGLEIDPGRHSPPPAWPSSMRRPNPMCAGSC